MTLSGYCYNTKAVYQHCSNILQYNCRCDHT